MLKRIWGYIRTWFGAKAEAAMDPEIEIQQAINEAREQDQKLRSQAAKVIAHRTRLEAKIESAAKDAGEAREMAKAALVRADKATQSGDAEGAAKWSQSAQSLALKLQAADSNLEGLKEQYAIALEQAEDAKTAVQQNAMRVQELGARRMELLGKIEQAKMQETVNKAVESMSASMETDVPSLDRVEDKITERLSEAKANAELREATPEGAEAELREAVSLSRAEDTLADLRAELGLGPAGELSS